MAFTRPLSLISAVRIQLTTLTSRAPQKAGPKPVTWKPATNTDTSHRQNAFRTSRNSPRVSKVIGKVSTTRMGRTTALTIPSTRPATSAEVRPARLMPGTTCAATSSASVYTTTRMMNPMVRSRVYTRLLASGLLLLAAASWAVAAEAPAATVDDPRVERLPVPLLQGRPGGAGPPARRVPRFGAARVQGLPAPLARPRGARRPRRALRGDAGPVLGIP